MEPVLLINFFGVYRQILVVVFLVGWSLMGFSNSVKDTVVSAEEIHLEEVRVRAYFVEQPLLRFTGAGAVIGQKVFDSHSATSLVHAVNTVPGVRMEERSPGSYRLSLRGSLLRSPYGVRNVKVYMDELPLTDAGGNTYLNVLDMNALSRIEVLKGPDGSLFGANSGGVVLLRPQRELSQVGRQNTEASASIEAGSFGLFYQQAKVFSKVRPGYQFSFNQSFQRSDGYRENTALKKLFFQTQHQWDYQWNKKAHGQSNQLSLLALYGDLDYRTPGGLTAAQFEENPRSARPATPTIPGAMEQGAGIRNRSFLTGVTHDWNLGGNWKNVFSVFGSYTDFTNPFINNFEKRYENNRGVRTYLATVQELSTALKMQMQTGLEWQSGDYQIENFDNMGGIAGANQMADHLKSSQLTTFFRLSLDWKERWLIEGSLSHNKYFNSFKSLYPTEELSFQSYESPSEWMPRIAVSYSVLPEMVWRATVSKGFSPPTVAEIRPSDQLINTSLEAETGWNYELGIRYYTGDRRVNTDISLFSYRMKHAIVRGLRDNGAEYFYNAGGTHQLGLELALQAWLLDASAHPFLPGIEWSAHWTFSHFRFENYRTDQGDFSGNALTGVPQHVVGQSLQFVFSPVLNAHLSYYYTSSLPLNDANSVYADSYHLLQSKISWQPFHNRFKRPLQLYIGADNLLNELYSLGNDINAFGGRYYNAAPARNFYIGISLHL